MNKILIQKPTLLLFDVYDTLLSMEQVERRVNQLVDSKRGYVIWFNQLMQQCFVDSLTGQFRPFTRIADFAMQQTRLLLKQVPRENEANQILELMKHLPVHEFVAEGLSSLYDKGFRIAALTNTAVSIVSERMERTGLISYFEQVISAEEIEKYKPATEVYLWAAKKLNAEAGSTLMVSSHEWDIAGARSAGMKTAQLSRRRPQEFIQSPGPDIICQTLQELEQSLDEL